MKKLTIVMLIVAAAVGGAVAWTLKPQPEPQYQQVEIPVGPMLKLEPKFDLGFFEQVWRRQLDLAQRAIARQGAQREVSEFCRPLVERGRVTEDGTQLIELPDVPRDDRRAVILKGRITDPWNPWGQRKLELFGAINTGDRFHDLYIPGASGEVEFGIIDSTDQTFATDNRFGWVQPTVTHGIAVGFGVVVALIAGLFGN